MINITARENQAEWIRDEDNDDPEDEKLWVPYEGPRGGEGYRNVESGEVQYTSNPPGKTAETAEEISDALGRQGGMAGKPLLGPTDSDGKIEIGLAKDATALTVDGQPGAPVVLEVGSDIVFDIETHGYPVYISESPGGGDYVDAVETNVMTENAVDEHHATDDGRLTFTPSSGVGRLYYESTAEEGMGGLIEVVASGSLRRQSAEVVEKMTVNRVVGSMKEVPDGVIAKMEDGHLCYEKEWVPYEGARGGEGWRSTVTESIRYTDEKPQVNTAPNADEITEEDVEDAEIHEITIWEETPADGFNTGDSVQYTTEDGYQWEGRVTDIGDDQLTLETESQREVPVPVGDDGRPEGGRFRRREPAFMGDGIAASNDSYLPEDEQASQTQLNAEALRSAAATDGYEDTEPIESYVAIATQRGEDPEGIEDSVRSALNEHPIMTPDMAPDIIEAGVERDEAESEEETEQAHREVEQDAEGIIDRIKNTVGLGSSGKADVDLSDASTSEVMGAFKMTHTAEEAADVMVKAGGREDIEAAVVKAVIESERTDSRVEDGAVEKAVSMLSGLWDRVNR